jgi:putative nucleotidyltransferase with HDIG domain
VSQERAALSRHANAYVYGITALGAIVLTYSVAGLIRHPVKPEWLILVLLTVISGWATLRTPSLLISLSISDTFVISAALLFGPSAGAITAALDGLVLSYRMLTSRRSAYRVLFNVAALAIATWGATQAFFALAGSRPLLEQPGDALRGLTLLAVFGAVDFGLNTLIIATAISFDQRRPIFAIWREHCSGLWVSTFGGVFGAMLLMVLARLSTLDGIVLIAPLPVLLYVTFRHALGRAHDQISNLGKLNKVYVAAIEALAQAIDAKDQVTHDHIRRVQEQAVQLARALRVSDEAEIEAIKAAALLHDVGKLAIPEHILNKPGRLTPSEYDIMKRHAPIGADILSVIEFPYPVVPIVRHHHENWDGSGYPDRLSGEQIPIGARILSVVDCFDALTSDRPYRPRLDDSDALQILADRRGTMYDPHVVDTFFALHSEAKSTPDIPRAIALPSAAVNTPLAPEVPPEEDALLLAFYKLGLALGASDSTRITGDTLWEHLASHLPAAAFAVFEHDDRTDSVVATCEQGPAAVEILGARIPVGERLTGWVAATGQTIMNSDARLDLEETRRAQSPLRSALAVPVVADGRVSAVLSFYALEPNAFDDGHRRLISAAARVLAARRSERRHATV